jgi:hypothetical protein
VSIAFKRTELMAAAFQANRTALFLHNGTCIHGSKLDIEAEIDQLNWIFKQADSVLHTAGDLQQLLTDPSFALSTPKAVIISCHGSAGQRLLLPIGGSERPLDNETSIAMLHEALTNGRKRTVRLVVLSACNSVDVAKQLLLRGHIQHVIATTANVPDETAIDFVATLFRNLLSGCKLDLAIELGKAMTASIDYVLLPQFAAADMPVFKAPARMPRGRSLCNLPTIPPETHGDCFKSAIIEARSLLQSRQAIAVVSCRQGGSSTAALLIAYDCFHRQIPIQHAVWVNPASHTAVGNNSWEGSFADAFIAAGVRNLDAATVRQHLFSQTPIQFTSPVLVVVNDAPLCSCFGEAESNGDSKACSLVDVGQECAMEFANRLLRSFSNVFVLIACSTNSLNEVADDFVRTPLSTATKASATRNHQHGIPVLKLQPATSEEACFCLRKAIVGNEIALAPSQSELQWALIVNHYCNLTAQDTARSFDRPLIDLEGLQTWLRQLGVDACSIPAELANDSDAIEVRRLRCSTIPVPSAASFDFSTGLLSAFAKSNLMQGLHGNFGAICRLAAVCKSLPLFLVNPAAAFYLYEVSSGFNSPAPEQVVEASDFGYPSPAADITTGYLYSPALRPRINDPREAMFWDALQRYSAQQQHYFTPVCNEESVVDNFAQLLLPVPPGAAALTPEKNPAPMRAHDSFYEDPTTIDHSLVTAQVQRMSSAFSVDSASHSSPSPSASVNHAAASANLPANGSQPHCNGFQCAQDNNASLSARAPRYPQQDVNNVYSVFSSRPAESPFEDSTLPQGTKPGELPWWLQRQCFERLEAEGHLQAYGAPGGFILRLSRNNPDKLVISALKSVTRRPVGPIEFAFDHVLVDRDASGRFTALTTTAGRRAFSSLRELVLESVALQVLLVPSHRLEFQVSRWLTINVPTTAQASGFGAAISTNDAHTYASVLPPPAEVQGTLQPALPQHSYSGSSNAAAGNSQHQANHHNGPSPEQSAGRNLNAAPASAAAWLHRAASDVRVGDGPIEEGFPE